MSYALQNSLEVRRKLLIIHRHASWLSDLSDYPQGWHVPTACFLSRVGDVNYEVMRATEEVILRADAIIREQQRLVRVQNGIWTRWVIVALMLLLCDTFLLAMLVLRH